MPEFKENKEGFKQTAAVKKMEETKQNVMTRSATPYSPFRMKAADYGNSPMRKNFGVGDPEGPDAPSPNKFGMFGGGAWAAMKARRDAARAGGGKGKGPGKNRGQVATNTGTAAAGDAGDGGEAIQNEAAMATDPVSAAGSTGVSAGPMFGEQGGTGAGNVPMHGPESHSGGGSIGGAPGVISKTPGRPGKKGDRINQAKAQGQGSGLGANILNPSNPTYSAASNIKSSADFDKKGGKGR